MLAFLLALAGCSDNALEGTFTDRPMAPGTLLLHVYPGSDGGLLPQSFMQEPLDEEGYGQVALSLAETVTVSGTLTALVSHPWSAAGAPTTPEPFVGSVQISLAGTVQNAATSTDNLGVFSLDLPADGDYDLYLSPSDPTAMAPYAVGAQSLFQDKDLTQELGEGAPLFGRVTAEGLGVPKAPLLLTRLQPLPEAVSVPFYTDSEGWYVVRAPGAGTYTVEVQGGLSGENEVLPTISRRVTIAEEGGTLDLDVGTLTGALLTGFIVNVEGDPVQDARVRLSSSALTDADGTLTVESSTDESGGFVARLLPGQYTAEILPAYGDPLSPMAVPITVELGSNDLGIIGLDGLNVINGVVNLPTGDTASGVTVTATQIGWSEYVYSTTTAQDGTYQLSLPATNFGVVCTPASTSGYATTRVDLPLGGDPSIMLVAGDLLTGSVLSADGLVSSYAVVEVREAATDLLLGTALTNADGVFELVIDMPLEDANANDTGDAADTAGDTGDSGDSGDSGDTAKGTDTAADTGDTAETG